jgi:hypothetical protein
MEQVGSKCMDFHDVLYPKIFGKSVKKIEDLLKYYRLMSTSHEVVCISMKISCKISSYNEKYFGQMLLGKSEYSFYIR